MSRQMMVICEPVSRMAGTLRLPLTRTSISCRGRQKVDGWAMAAGWWSQDSSCTVVRRAGGGGNCESSGRAISYSLDSTCLTLIFLAMSLRMAGLAAKT